MSHSTVSAHLNAELLEENLLRWQEDQFSVSPEWAAFFEGFELGSAMPPSKSNFVEPSPNGSKAKPENISHLEGRVGSLIYNYRMLGHTQAYINPLKHKQEKNPRLLPEAFGFTPAELESDVSIPFWHKGKTFKLKELIELLEATYSSKIGFEFMHISNTEIRHWVRKCIEDRPLVPSLEKASKRRALKWLMEAELFEKFLHKRFLGEKRFSLEGGEGLMILLNRILEGCPLLGVKEIEMGMAHRGRLNVLAHIVGKSLRTILYEFTPNYVPDLIAGDGDVKYHLGYENVRQLSDGEIRISLAANPSHLEGVNAVVEGKARARQRLTGDDGTETDRKTIIPILLHGDAAFAGQGSVAEVLNYSQLPGYRTGGTIHIIINNQIGFTTTPEDARTSVYATGVAKMIGAPIIHVNGESPKDLFWVAEFALAFRQRYGRDIVIDMICYRRQGHNENDQAAFTQPHIYRELDTRKSVAKIYLGELFQNQDLTPEEAEQIHKEIWDNLEDGYQEMKRLEELGERDVFHGSTAVAQSPYNHDPVITGIKQDTFQKIGETLTHFPSEFNLHPTLAKRFIPRRAQAIESGKSIDWALAESLAWGALLLEGYPVRLSGQDCRRGTFSQRHAVFYDYQTRERYTPLKHLGKQQAKFCVYNSLLSEAGVLGFDYGYSLGCPSMLIMWEAQFGDFSNGAQVIIDQFISSAESKWQTPSSLVMLLPHGYEGMGPEHSSARLERFLQLCAESNIIVGNFTTPAQYFHALRRQKKRSIQKPLIIMTPKSLLTNPQAISSYEDIGEDTSFLEIIPDMDALDNRLKIRRVIFSTGKVYYDLYNYRKREEIKDTALIRIEQIYPLHEELVSEILSFFSNAKHYVWCQEEPKNMGAWSFISPRLNKVVGRRLRYAGRSSASSPATGSKAVHIAEQKRLVEQAFEV